MNNNLNENYPFITDEDDCSDCYSITIHKNNIYSLIGNIWERSIRVNGDGETLLYECGLEHYINDYKNKLNPYRFSGVYQIENEVFNPKLVCIEICNKLEDDVRLIFLNNILSKVNYMSKDEFDCINAHLNPLNLELYEESKDINKYNYKISCLINPILIVKTEPDQIYKKLYIVDEKLAKMYEETIDSYSKGKYKSSIDNLRRLFSFFFQHNSIDKNMMDGICHYTNETKKDCTYPKCYKEILGEINKTKNSDEKSRLFAKTREIYALYSSMSALFVHNENEFCRMDALDLIRKVISTIDWCLSKEY